MSNIQKLRQYVKALENTQRYFYPSKTLMANSMSRLYERVRGRSAIPYTKNAAMKMKFAAKRSLTYNKPPWTSEWPPSISYTKMHHALEKAKENLKNIYGKNMTHARAVKLLTLAEIRAARTIAKALNSNAVMNRVKNKRRTRNFIRTELSMYQPRSGSLIRPSNVKARRIVSP